MTAKAQNEKTAADAAARAHGEPVTILSMDWNGLVEKFRVTFGPDLCDNELPAKSCCEEFEERVASKRRCCLKLCQKRKLKSNVRRSPIQQGSTECIWTASLHCRRGEQRGTNEPRAAPSQVHSVANHVALGAAPSARPFDLQRPHQEYL